MTRTWLRAALLCALVLTLGAGCRGGGAPADTVPALAADAQVYVSLGDSYAAGYQPDGNGGGGTTRDGFAYQVADRADVGGAGMTLVNYGCAGVTSSTMVDDPGCAASALGPGAPAYPDEPQARAALALLTQRAGSVRLVTISIGGNDLQPCLDDADPQGCVEERLPVLRRNLDGLLTAIRASVGPSVPVVGITYPDVYLGLYLKGDPSSLEIARRSKELFQTYLNPMLQQVYSAHGARFVDVTRLTGAYGSLGETRQLAPYGTIPVPVARVCQLTWFCTAGDVHPNRSGYALIASAVLEAART